MPHRYNLIRTQDALDEPSSPLISTKDGNRPCKWLKGERRAKRVHFRILPEGAEEFSEGIHLIPALVDLTIEEKESVWLTRRDLQQMDDALRLDLMRSSLRHHETELGENPLRGLEWKTFDGIHQRNSHRKQGLQAVLEEQARQRSSNDLKDIDPLRIATSYHQAIGFCQERAREVAIQDEQIASQALREDIQVT